MIVETTDKSNCFIHSFNYCKWEFSGPEFTREHNERNKISRRFPHSASCSSHKGGGTRSSAVKQARAISEALLASTQALTETGGICCHRRAPRTPPSQHRLPRPGCSPHSRRQMFEGSAHLGAFHHAGRADLHLLPGIKEINPQILAGSSQTAPHSLISERSPSGRQAGKNKATIAKNIPLSLSLISGLRHLGHLHLGTYSDQFQPVKAGETQL